MSLSAVEPHVSPTSRTEKTVLASVAAIVVVMIVGSWLALRTAATEILKHEAVSHAQSSAIFVSSGIANLDRLLAGEAATPEDIKVLNSVGEFGGAFRYKLYGADGSVKQASDPDDIGSTKRLKQFPDTAAKGHVFARLGYSDGFGDMPAVYAEAYVPVMRDGRFIGAIETDIDVANLAASIDQKSRIALLGLSVLFCLFGLSIRFVYLRHSRKQRDYLEAVTTSEEDHRHLFEFLPYPMLVHTEGRIIYANAAMLESILSASRGGVAAKTSSRPLSESLKSLAHQRLLTPEAF